MMVDFSTIYGTASLEVRAGDAAELYVPLSGDSVASVFISRFLEFFESHALIIMADYGG
jgi:hypothetical protein